MNTVNHTTPLKLAVLVRMFPNIVQTYVLNHIMAMKDSGIDTLIVAENNPQQNEIHPRVIKNKLVEETLYIDTEKASLIKQLLSTSIFSTNYLRAILKIFFSTIWQHHGVIYGIKTLARLSLPSRNDIDIIHSHSLFCSYDYLFMKEVFGVPITTTFHGLVPQNIKMLDSKKIKAVLNAGDVFFVNTKFARKQLTDLGCNNEKIHIIPQSTNTQDFPFVPRKIVANNDIIILSVGRLSIEKGFHIAIQAIAKLVQTYPDIKYHIVGGGPEENALTKLINDLDLQEHVKIFGAISTEKLLAHYSGAHIFVLPSIDFRDGTHTETQGVVLQEAQSSGLPIVASKTGGIPEIIVDDKTGLLFDEENVEQLSLKISAIINDPNIYHALHLQGRKDVEDNYSIKVIGDKLLDVYKKVLS